MKNFIPLIALGLVLSSCSARLLTEADTHYENLEYYQAAAKYNEYLGKTQDHSADIKLAQCYLKMNHLADAEKQFSKAMTNGEVTAMNKLEFAHVLKHLGKYKEARKWYREYLAENPKDLAVRNELTSCDSFVNYNRYKNEYTVEPVLFNNQVSNFSPVFYREGIVFCSERTPVSKPEELSLWTGHNYLDLYYINPMEKGGAAIPVSFSSELNSPYHEGPACFTEQGNRIYFTRNLLDSKKRPEKNKKSVNNFEIYTASISNGIWSEPQTISFDNKNYSVGHPALTRDGNRMFFVSDMPGGFGGTDIYYSDRNSTTGEWGAPVNAGENINTSENEMFPTTWTDEQGNQYLYFSSEGREGMGGLDIYYAQILGIELAYTGEIEVKSSGGNFTDKGETKKVKMLSEPKHLHAPINSPGDDFGMVLGADGLSGYFSSDRDNQDGIDRIYSFRKTIKQYFLEIKVKEKGKENFIPGARVEIAELNSQTEDVEVSDNSGVVFKKITTNSILNIQASKPGYYTVTTTGENIGNNFVDTLRLIVEMEPVELNKAITLDNIYYDYDRSELRADAAPALDKLIALRKQNPGIRIELSSHTDSRGKDKYNLVLSQKRAQSVVDYIIGQGICKERIYAKGYGETKLLNGCSNKVSCGDDEHQVNRRTEFSVVQIENLPLVNCDTGK